jgi:hypothetical protein
VKVMKSQWASGEWANARKRDRSRGLVGRGSGSTLIFAKSMAEFNRSQARPIRCRAANPALGSGHGFVIGRALLELPQISVSNPAVAGCNSDLAQYSTTPTTPSLRVAGLEDEHEALDLRRCNRCLFAGEFCQEFFVSQWMGEHRKVMCDRVLVRFFANGGRAIFESNNIVA